MSRATPPFRADHVGSLLRPAGLKEARARRERGEITIDDLRVIENTAIEHIVARQSDVGLRSATDGEFRRAMWHFDFLEHLDEPEPDERKRPTRRESSNGSVALKRATRGCAPDGTPRKYRCASRTQSGQLNARATPY